MNPPVQQATENYTIHKYFDSEYKSKVITAEDKYSTKLSALASNEPAPTGDFYNSPTSSTNTIRQKSLTSNQLTPIQRYVDSICNFDQLIDWRSIAKMRNTPTINEPSYQLDRPTFSNNREVKQMWSEKREHEYKCESTNQTTNESQLEQCIRRVEHKSTVEHQETVVESGLSRNMPIRHDNFLSPSSNSILPPIYQPPTNNYLTSVSESPKSFDEEESTKTERRIVHGKVLPISGKVSPAAYLLRTNSTCKAGLTTDIAQEWSLDKDPQTGHAEASFFPYPQSHAQQNLEEPRIGLPPPQLIQQQLNAEPQLSVEQQMLEDEARKLAELEDYVKRQLRLMDRETQTTPMLRMLANQTPDELYARLQQSVDNPIYKVPTQTTETSSRYEVNRQFQTLPTRTQQRIKDDSNDLTLLKQTLLEVERNAGSAQRRFHKTVSEDALLIEKAILKVSEELQRRGPLSEAQMLASEELLRSKIAEAILNLKPSIPTGYSNTNTPTESFIEIDTSKISENQAEQIDILRDPIIKLKDKLGKLEKQLIYDEEESIREELQQINSMKMEGSDSQDVQMREKHVRSRTETVARMTPLIVLVKNKLSNLDYAVDQQAVVLDTSKKSHKSQQHRLIGNENSRSIHRLLMNINDEIAKIHSLCRENKKIDSVNLVVEVLAKVCKSIDAILEGFHKNEDLSEMSTSLSTTATSPPPVTNIVTVKLNKPEQVEETNTLLMYWSAGEETHSLSAKLDADFKREFENLTTKASVKVQEFAHVNNKLKAPIKKEEIVFKKVENVEQIPEINLIAPHITSKKSEVRSEIGVNVQNRAENKRIETLLRNQPTTTSVESRPQTSIVNVNKKLSQPEESVIIVRRKNAEFSSPNENVLTKSQEEDISYSDNVPILFANRRSSLLLPGRETDIISSDDDDQPNLQIVDVRNNVWEKFKLKKHRRNYRVNAFIYPAVRFQLIATVSGNDFQVSLFIYFNLQYQMF